MSIRPTTIYFLAHLLKCVAGAEATSVAIGAGDEIYTQRSRQISTDSNGSYGMSHSFSRSRNVSTSSFKGINPDGAIEEERTLSFLPLPLYLLLQADQEDYKKVIVYSFIIMYFYLGNNITRAPQGGAIYARSIQIDNRQ